MMTTTCRAMPIALAIACAVRVPLVTAQGPAPVPRMAAIAPDR
jgi:hypothetical protein